MKTRKFKAIDYGFRPQSYQEMADPLETILLNVKGTNRRKMIRDFGVQGSWKNSTNNTSLVRSTTSRGKDLEEFTRPSWAGNTFQTCKRTKRKSHASNWSRPRAMSSAFGPRPTQSVSAFASLDEYETEFEQPFETSERPLTLEELIGFINGSGPLDFDGGLALVFNNTNVQGSDRASLRHFTTITSEVYPQLYEHFEQVFDDWAREPQEEES